MKRFPTLLVAIALLLPIQASSQQEEAYDYWRFNRNMIQYGQQAILMCNGLFTSNRTLEQVYDQELAYLRQPVGTPRGGDYVVDWERKAVAIGAPGGTPVMRAAFRKGLGCVIMAPDQTFEDIESLPILDMPPAYGDPATTPWPDGDLVENQALPVNVDARALAAASAWAFDRESPEQVTLSLMVVHEGQVIHERYAPGVNVTTRTRTWSTAKSIAVTLPGARNLEMPMSPIWLGTEVPGSRIYVCSTPNRRHFGRGWEGLKLTQLGSPGVCLGEPLRMPGNTSVRTHATGGTSGFGGAAPGY